MLNFNGNTLVPLPPYPEPEDEADDGIMYPDDDDDKQPLSNRYFDDRVKGA